MPTRPPTHRPPRLDAPAHQPAPPVPRPSASARGYGKRWQRLAQRFRRAHPFCADPFGVHDQPVPGAHVDHVVPRSAGGSDDWSNLQTLCASCHSCKTALLDGGFGRPPPGGHEFCAIGRGTAAGSVAERFEGFGMGGSGMSDAAGQ